MHDLHIKCFQGCVMPRYIWRNFMFHHSRDRICKSGHWMLLELVKGTVPRFEDKESTNIVLQDEPTRVVYLSQLDDKGDVLRSDNFQCLWNAARAYSIELPYYLEMVSEFCNESYRLAMVYAVCDADGNCLFATHHINRLVKFWRALQKQ